MVNAAVQTTISSHEAKPSLLHAVCKIRCPLAVVLIVLEKNAGGAANKDSVGRLPLHEAASRSGYSIKVPLGISQADQLIEEESPVHTLLQEFPEGARIADAQLQLPLHCAIEANSSSKIIEELLRYHPDALERRDGKTGLYPFMQANGVEVAFMLLQRDPTFCAIAVDD
jgi:ankyrin repeat protein